MGSRPSMVDYLVLKDCYGVVSVGRILRPNVACEICNALGKYAQYVESDDLRVLADKVCGVCEQDQDAVVPVSGGFLGLYKKVLAIIERQPHVYVCRKDLSGDVHLDCVVWRGSLYVFYGRVRSESKPDMWYSVVLSLFPESLEVYYKGSRCTCDFYRYRKRMCKHMRKMLQCVRASIKELVGDPSKFTVGEML